MEKSRIIRYMACFTIVLMLLSVLPGGALAVKAGNGQGNENSGKYVSEDDTNADDENESEDGDLEDDSGALKDRDQDRDRLKENVQALKEERKLEKEQLQEQLKSCREEYQEAKGDFLQTRNRIRDGSLDSDSDEAMNSTRLYLNSSINYMIAHLENVKGNIEYSNGNGTQNRTAALEEKIRLLQTEQAEIRNASSYGDFGLAVESIRGVWNNAQKTSLKESGQTVSERIEAFLEKSDALSEKIEAEIEALNDSGVNTTELEEKLADYNALIESAEENKKAADAIYEDEEALTEDLEEANEYLRAALEDIRNANQIIKEIFEELKEYEINGIEDVGDGEGEESGN